MPALANKTYFNYGGQGPLPTPSLEAITSTWQRIQELGPFTTEVWPLVEATMAALRQRLAGWLGVPADQLAFTENVTSGCVLPLWGLPWRPGDQLLVSDCEHPGVVAACRELARRQGLELHTLVVRDLLEGPEATAAALMARLEAALTPASRLVVLSHLLWNTGQVMPIDRVAARLGAHPRRPWLLVDAAQSLGSIPVATAAAAADIYACTGHKWCCGPEGLGVVALSRRLLAEAQPTLIGWRSLGQEGSAESDFHADARRFEVATSCLPLFAGLNRSLELLEAEGNAEQRLQRSRSLAAELWQRLGDMPGVVPLLKVPPPAGLVSFTVAGQAPEAVVGGLGQRRIWLRSLDDPHCLRACTHVTSTADDLDLLMAALAEQLAVT
ncbi:aminotransferase class V-fold PLP-dependent enzyme [Cyanobium sp. CH-040]|uniref:aminotransferase class V-fold PLP-dependent enzyme n=1 Tax=Cyanobium sp. CH-040 TaxID=2823708 RepID=UPI0020CB868F|nr:aminotransferase class V-fold PLP-dependent enzyme [Cyanobium sp. CH-040]MCP9926442.1 aminotransferase class V-fold PLP-dependent enzyme [Cyanobium sp. CH-040]